MAASLFLKVRSLQDRMPATFAVICGSLEKGAVVVIEDEMLAFITDNV